MIRKKIVKNSNVIENECVEELWRPSLAKEARRKKLVHLPQWFSWRHSRVACVPRYPSWSQAWSSSDWSVPRSRGMVIGLRWAGRSERGRGASWKIAKVAEGEERISSCPPGVCYSPWSCSFRSFSLPLSFSLFRLLRLDAVPFPLRWKKSPCSRRQRGMSATGHSAVRCIRFQQWISSTWNREILWIKPGTSTESRTNWKGTVTTADHCLACTESRIVESAVARREVHANMSSFLMNPSTGGGYHHHQHQQAASSHHLAATSVMVDPKFPPSEEYSQSNYIPSTGAEFFPASGGGHHLNHPQSHQLQYGYHQHHHQAASTPYGASSAVQLNGGYAGYGSYYGPHHPHHQVHAVHHASLHPHHHAVGALAMPPEAQQPPLTCPSSMQNQQQPQQQQPPVSASTVLGSTPLSPGIMQNHVQPPDSLQHHQQPSQQQTPHESNACSPASSSQLHRDNSPDLQQQPSTGQQSQHIQNSQQQQPTQQQQQNQQQSQQQHHVDEGSDQDDMEDDQMMDGSPGMLEDEEEEEENGDRVIYPWMKKIHVAGVGELELSTPLFIPTIQWRRRLSNCSMVAQFRQVPPRNMLFPVIWRLNVQALIEF